MTTVDLPGLVVPIEARIEDYFLNYHGCESACFDYDFAERMLDELRVCEDPDVEL